MFEKIVKNLEKGQINFEEAEYLLFTDDDCINNLYQKAMDIHEDSSGKIRLESKIFYPLIYSIKSNCPTCGYRTPESHRQYNIEYMESVIKYNIDLIKSHAISKVNCLCIDNDKNYERDLFLKSLNKQDIDKAIKIENIEDIKIIKKYDYHSLIVDSQNTEVLNFIQNNSEFTSDYDITINLEVYNNNLKNNVKFINKLKNYDINSLEIIGYDPFCEDMHEYNPQYTKKYIKRTVSILKIMYPDLKLKISYASNGNNFLEELLPLGINCINGIYCQNTNKLFNIEKVMTILQKMGYK
jgi:hypothetical protein